MAFRTWGRLLLTALGVSVLAGAGQLGIAYGFGVVRLDGAFADGTVNRWPAQLAWVGWFAAVAAVAGAVLTERFARRDRFRGGTTEQLSVAGAAALGATVVAPLCMQPARAAELGGTLDPVWAVGICAILGALVGAGASIAVLLKPPFGWNIVLTAGAVWVLALLSAAPTVASARPLHTVRLGVLEPAWLNAGAAQRLAMLILPTVALLAGAAVGALARHRGHPPLVGGAAGVAGPVLLAFAYLTAGPGDTADRYQLAPYYGALIAVAAGVLGSAAATVLPRPVTEAGSDAIEPTDILQPLPPSPTTPSSPAAGTSALATRSAPEGGDHEPARTADERETGPTGTGRPTPAHWDWPVPSGVTLAPVPTDGPGTPMPASLTGSRGTDEPTPADLLGGPNAHERAPGRETEGLTRALPGLLPPGRRTAAIDVLAAGRPAGHPPAEPPGPAPATPAAPVERLADPAPDGRPDLPEPATPAASAPDPSPPVESEITARPATSEPDPETPEAESGSPGVPPAASTPAPDATPAAVPRSGRQRASSPRAGTATVGSTGTDPVTATSPDAAEMERPETPAPDRAAQTEPRPTGRPKRGRKGRTSPAAAEPAGTTASTERAGSPGTPPPAEPPAGPPAEPDDVPAAEAPDTGTDSRPGEPRFSFDPEPVGTGLTDPVDAPASPRPRFPIFEDVPDGPGTVRPAWPIAPASSRPANPRGDAGTAGGTDPDGTPAEAARVEPAPRPRHRALPDLGRSPGWDAFATARQAIPGTPESPQATNDGRHLAPTPAGSPPTVDDPHAGEHPAAPSEVAGEPGGGTAKQRRGLFRRYRAKATEVTETDREAESLAQDEEYVDWVAGLSSDDNADGARTLHTGRHHRD